MQKEQLFWKFISRCLKKYINKRWMGKYLVVFRIQGAQGHREIMTDFPCAAYSPACRHGPPAH